MKFTAKAKRRAGFESLRKTLRGLREVASGEVLSAVIERAGAYVRGRVTGELKKHTKGTGLALKTARVTTSMQSLDMTLQDYRRYIKWSFAKGFPRSAINRIQKLLSEELAKAMGGK